MRSIIVAGFCTKCVSLRLVPDWHIFQPQCQIQIQYCLLITERKLVLCKAPSYRRFKAKLRGGMRALVSLHLHCYGKVEGLVHCEELGLQRNEQTVNQQLAEVPDGGQATAEKAPSPQLQVQHALHKNLSFRNGITSSKSLRSVLCCSASDQQQALHTS